MGYAIRQLSPSDEEFLREMLYLSLHVPEGGSPFPRDVIERPEIAKYVRGWGRAGDMGFVAVDAESGEPIGAAWLRLLAGDERGYGHVDDETPELGMAVLPEFRGRGVGSGLLARLLESAGAVYGSVCLSVSADNPAARLYGRAGFEPVCERGTSLTMVKRLRP
ncbi:MAG TPA: GNAT family N-acetyltransferase [Pyrinomonadaceae bacterium]|nr:GNAT family N-acetyltransferase [Pyrinomonadaceae bacterium]